MPCKSIYGGTLYFKYANIGEELITKKKLIKKRNIWFIQVITKEIFITE
jgi:hypothetical protein